MEDKGTTEKGGRMPVVVDELRTTAAGYQRAEPKGSRHLGNPRSRAGGWILCFLSICGGGQDCASGELPSAAEHHGNLDDHPSQLSVPRRRRHGIHLGPRSRRIQAKRWTAARFVGTRDHDLCESRGEVANGGCPCIRDSIERSVAKRAYMIQRFDHVTIVVRDLDQARRFFGLLGFTEDK